MRNVILAGLVVALLGAVSPAEAAVRIAGSPGGRIGDFLLRYMQLAETGERVVIDGPCLSACTLVLGMVPRERICVTSRAVLGFHAAWMPDGRGRRLTHAGATHMMMETYPYPVRAWIRRKGGLTRRTILLHGRELARLYPRCG